MIERKRVARGGEELIELIPENENDVAEIVRLNAEGVVDARESFADSRPTAPTVEDVSFSAPATFEVCEFSPSAAQLKAIMDGLVRELGKSANRSSAPMHARITLPPKPSEGRFEIEVAFTILPLEGRRRLQVYSIERVMGM